MATITIRAKDHVRVIRPKADGENRFDGSVGRLVEAVTKSNYRKGIKNYVKYYVS